MRNAVLETFRSHIKNLIDDVLDINSELLYMDTLTERQ